MLLEWSLNQGMLRCPLPCCEKTGVVGCSASRVLTRRHFCPLLPPPLVPSSIILGLSTKWFIFIGPKWQQCCDTLCCRYEAAGRWRRTMARAIQWECWPCAQCSCVSRIDYTVPLCEDHRKRGQQLCIHAGGSPRASTATGTWKDACVLE